MLTGMSLFVFISRGLLAPADAFPFHAPRCDRVVANAFTRLAALETSQGPMGS
jgi:hypothetical protein